MENAAVVDENNKIEKSLNNLKRRVDLTRRARFACSTRLRHYSSKTQNFIVYYNIIIVFVSIFTMYTTYKDSIPWYPYLVLACSVTLSFFSTHIAGKKYKEKAILMEHNGHDLTRVYGKIEVLQSTGIEIKSEDLSNIYKQYEAILMNVENHDEIDYIKVKVNCGEANVEELRKLKNHKLFMKWKFIAIYFIPLLLVIVFLFYPLNRRVVYGRQI